jgi:DNA polymerase I-like protein with 3'-5' exonuclease and polymerase domains
MTNDKFNPVKKFALDTETTGLRHRQNDQVFSVSMCDEEGETWFCEWEVDPFTRNVLYFHEDIDFINKFASDPNIENVFHNSKFDIGMMRKFGVVFEGKIHDTYIAARVCNNIEFSLGLKNLAKKYLDIPEDDEKELKKAVTRARNFARKFNREQEECGLPKRILLADDSKADYWLPKYFDPSHNANEEYCRKDTFRTMGLHLWYEQIMESDPYLKTAYEEEMFKIYPAVIKMENRGMSLDPEQVRVQLARAYHDIDFHLGAMQAMVAEHGLQPFEDPECKKEFNPGSTKQLRRVMYLPKGEGGLGLFTKRESDSGGLSTDKKAIRELIDQPFVQHLVQYRAAQQVIGLFFEKYLDLMIDCPMTGDKVLHPGLNQCGTVTFRFSSNDPNLQQVGNPQTSGNTQFLTFNARAPFRPRTGYDMYGADFSQQELRILAHTGQIPFLLEQINTGQDPNSGCANKAWGGKNNPAALKAASYAMELGSPESNREEVQNLWKEIGWNEKAAREFGFMSTRSYMVADEWLSQFDYDIVLAEKSLGKSSTRGRAKQVLFAKVYGGGPTSVMEILYCTYDQASSFMADYDRAIPELNIYMKEMIARAQKDGFIINPYGRKIRVDKDYAYRSVNYMVQSTAACMMKNVIVRCDQFLEKTGLDAHNLMSIHDELIFEIKKGHDKKWLLRGLCTIMEDTEGRISVPTPVEMKRYSTTWSKHEKVIL